MSECCICSDKLTLKTIVNLECGHSFCKDCIWRWTKDKNTCPCCRANILGNTKELQEMQHMRELITHRSRIVRQVEEEYERVDMLKTRANDIEKGIRMAQKELNRDLDVCEILQKKITFYKQLSSGTYSAIKCLEKKLRERNKNMESIQTKDYHELVFQGEVLLDLKDLHSEAKQRNISPTKLVAFQKRQKKVQIQRQQWQEESSLINYEIDNEGLRLDRIFDDTKDAEEQHIEQQETEEDYSDMPPLVSGSYDMYDDYALEDPDDIRRIFTDTSNLTDPVPLENITNTIHVYDRVGFLENMIEFLNNSEPIQST